MITFFAKIALATPVLDPNVFTRVSLSYGEFEVVHIKENTFESALDEDLE